MPLVSGWPHVVTASYGSVFVSYYQVFKSCCCTLTATSCCHTFTATVLPVFVHCYFLYLYIHCYFLSDTENYPHLRTLLHFDTREFLNVLTLVRVRGQVESTTSHHYHPLTTATSLPPTHHCHCHYSTPSHPHHYHHTPPLPLTIITTLTLSPSPPSPYIPSDSSCRHLKRKNLNLLKCTT